MPLIKNKSKLITAIAIPLISGSIAGTMATKSAKQKYQKLKTPSFSPPSWAFPVAWTSLYTFMGIAKYKFDINEKPARLQKKGDAAYTVQLGLNFLWSFLFFRWGLRGTAFIEAALLWTTIFLTACYFYQTSLVAASLMAPYIIWVSFALVLNYAIWDMNRDSK